MTLSLALSIISLCFGSGILVSGYKFIRLLEGKVNALMFGVQANLRDRLLETYYRYKKQGYMSFEEKQSWLNTYEAYHNLGKNGVMDSVKDEIMKMEVKTDD